MAASEEWLALKLRFKLALLLQVVEVFHEQHPRGLLGVVQLRRAAGLQNIVDVLKRLFKHESFPRNEGVCSIVCEAGNAWISTRGGINRAYARTLAGTALESSSRLRHSGLPTWALKV